MNNELTKDYFDCPNCGIKNVTYKVLSTDHEFVKNKDKKNGNFLSETDWGHYLIQCSRVDCQQFTYFKIKESFRKPGIGWSEFKPTEIEIQYPSNNSLLPEYVPEKIKYHYKEAIDAYNFGLLSSASVMCRKCIYEICDNQKSTGHDYKQKIKNLGFDKRITDPLLNIKNIGDETVHSNGWDKKTIEKAINVLGIIIDMVYTQENRIKDFTKHYSKVNQDRKKMKN